MSHGLSKKKLLFYEDFQNRMDSWIASEDEEFFQRIIPQGSEEWEKGVANGVQY